MWCWQWGKVRAVSTDPKYLSSTLSTIFHFPEYWKLPSCSAIWHNFHKSESLIAQLEGSGQEVKFILLYSDRLWWPTANMIAVGILIIILWKCSGLNSGVIFMNLTKMRDFQWVSYLEPIYERYKSNLKYGDQGILTAFFHFFPGMSLLFNKSKQIGIYWTKLSDWYF